jgi:peroxiredoxin
MARAKKPLGGRAPMYAVLALIGLLAAVGAWWLPLPAPRPAPAVAFQLLDGRTTALSEYRGRPVMVWFWATSCTPCLEQLPALSALYQNWHSRGLEIVAVAMPFDDPVRVRALVTRQSLPWPVALDAAAEVTRAFDGVPIVPTAYVIDDEGRIVAREAGALDIARLDRIIGGLARR